MRHSQSINVQIHVVCMPWMMILVLHALHAVVLYVGGGRRLAGLDR